MLEKRIVLGTSDFKTFITENFYFVDKSLLIKDVVQGSTVLLFPRPRRFGKTLNLTMLKYFYDMEEDNAHLFSHLKISNEKAIMQKQGKHPVIYITLKDVKNNNWKACYEGMAAIIAQLYSEFRYLLDSETIDELDKASMQRILNETAKESDNTGSLKRLSRLLYQHHKAKPVILIDEYDTPIHTGYERGFYNEVIDFMRIFLGSALKDGDHLEKAVLTGILRVSRESMFSGLNNIKVCSITSATGADKFGFTEDEVVDLLEFHNNPFTLAEIKHWYDGYNFGGFEIYNPWSILSSIDDNRLLTHWINTSNNDLVKQLCIQANNGAKQELEILTLGGSIQKVIDDNIVFSELGKDKNALWSFLLHTGYLRYDNLYVNERGEIVADLSIPNFEILGLFKQHIIKNWFTPPDESMELLANITKNLTTGDIEVFKAGFVQYCLETISYYDISKKEPEKTYHILVLGMLSCLKSSYHIYSNRESGLGRNDVMLIPRDTSQGGRGIVIEFKKVNTAKNETFQKVIQDAKRQIVKKKYAQELQARNCKEIYQFVVACAGKEVQVEVVE